SANRGRERDGRRRRACAAQDGTRTRVWSVLVARFAGGDAPPSDGAAARASRRRVRGRALAIGLSVTPFAVSFGAVSVATGLSLLQTCLLSLVLFSGASQFALVSILGAGGGLAAALATALLLGVRNALYGVSVRSLLGARGALRPVAAEVTIDESTAMALAEAPRGFAPYAFWCTALSVYVLWNVSTLAGALVGRGLGSLAVAGLDAAGPAVVVGGLLAALAYAGWRR